MQATEAVQWKMEEWELPRPLPRVKTRAGMPVCPFVGLDLPYYARERHLKKVWFSKREVLSWEIQPFRRRALYKLLKRNFSSWIDWLRIDSTPTFYRDMEGFKKRQSGAVIGIAGPKMCGKSRLGQMLLTRLVDTQPHVLFQYKDLEHHVKDRDNLSIAIQIDEDLKATGNESRNLVVHVNNSFETSRKADLWAICTGVNLNFQYWGDTLDLRMIPFGFNADFQATRAAIFDKENDFLGFCVFQRQHLPKDPVFYYNTEGYWGEYEARARAYSLAVTKKGGVQDAVDDITQTEHIETLKRYFKLHYVDKGISLPKDLMCRRLYRKAKIPAKSVSYTNEIIAWAKFELAPDIPKDPHPLKKSFGVFSKDWNGLRKFIEQWCLKHNPPHEEYATATALWIVPDEEGISQDDIFDMIDFSGKSVKVGTLGRNIRILRKRIQRPDLEFTDFTESWVASQLDSLGARKAGGKNAPDVVLPGGRHVAVKFCVRNDPFYDYTVSPETDGVVIIIIPRRLQFFIIPIKDNVVNEHLQLDNVKIRAGGVLVGIEDLVDTVKEMIDGV